MKVILKICLLSSLLILQACDIFESRDPQSPDEPKSSYLVPVVPTDVIKNLKNSFKDKNSNDYKKNFSSGSPLVDRNFYFIPSSNDLNINPIDWTVAQEFQYFNNLVIKVPQSIPMTLTFSDEQYDLQADSAIYAAKYLISVPVLNSVPVNYEGNLRFFMVTDRNAAWVIYFWEDIASQGLKSWSNLKSEYAP
jgi:hypothetical protein